MSWTGVSKIENEISVRAANPGLENIMDFAGFIEPEDSRWAKFLKKTRHDFYHLPGYVSLAGHHEKATATAFYAECGDSAVLIPLLHRQLPSRLNAPKTWCDLTSPYGYPSPLYHPGSDEIPLGEFIRAFESSAEVMEAVCAFFRFHPLLPFPLEALGQHGTLVHHGQTVVIDLQKSPEEIWNNTRENHRENILSLMAEGFTTVMDDWTLWKDFTAIYQKTMDRLKAKSCYCFSDSYFEKFRSILGPRLHLCSTLSPSGEVAASGLITDLGGIMQFHLAATALAYIHNAPSKLMFDGVRRWAQGISGEKRYLHLGGGVAAKNDNLFRFKAGFSKDRAEFHTFRMVFDQERYDFLVGQDKAPSSAEGDEDGYFPLYRR